MLAQAIFHTAPEQVEIGEFELPPLAADEVLVSALYSAISPGTEGLIYRGSVPNDLSLDTKIPELAGHFEYPFRYGYALVGRIIEQGAAIGPEWKDRLVFVFHPHQNLAVVKLEACLPVPTGISADAALILPNMESALNFVMDANPVIGDSIGIFGLGVVGLLCTALLSEIALTDLIGIDKLDYRRSKALSMGASEAQDPENREHWNELKARLTADPEPNGLDIAFELSGNMDVLNRAIELTGFAGKIIIGSWYGNQSKPIELGGRFHRSRIRLISSQVSSLNPKHSARWSKGRRIQLAWSMIKRIEPERLITHIIPFSDCKSAFQINADKTQGVIQTIFEYPG